MGMHTDMCMCMGMGMGMCMCMGMGTCTGMGMCMCMCMCMCDLTAQWHLQRTESWSRRTALHLYNFLCMSMHMRMPMHMLMHMSMHISKHMSVHMSIHMSVHRPRSLQPAVLAVPRPRPCLPPRRPRLSQSTRLHFSHRFGATLELLLPHDVLVCCRCSRH